MKAIIKKYFSMVEVALAIGILAVGAATVITLFPVGMKQTKDSMGQNYSAIFAEDTYAYISSLAKNPNEWNSGGTFVDTQRLPDKKPDTDNPNNVIKSLQELSKIPGTDIMETGTPGIYAIAKGTTSRGEQDYAAQVLVWRGTPCSQSNDVISRTLPPPPVPETPFNISSGTVSNTAPVNISLSCLGVHMEPLDPHIAVSVTTTKLDGTPLTKPDGTPFLSNPPSYLTQSSYNWNPSGENAPVGTRMVISARSNLRDSWNNDPGTVLSTNANQAWVLKNGDPVPTIPGFGSQIDLKDVIKPYTENGKMKLADNEVIYGFELYTKNTRSTAYDMQDLVILATLAPKDTTSLQTSITGIGISPTNTDYAFDMTKSDGTHITRDDLKTRNVYDESFSANNVVMRTKNGDGAAITVGSENVSLDGRDVTINAASNGSLKVKIWNNNSGLGNWYVQLLEGSTGNATTGGETTPPTGGGTTSTSITVGVGVNVEISWPLHQTDYNKRTKLRYYFEVYDLNNIGASTSS